MRITLPVDEQNLTILELALSPRDLKEFEKFCLREGYNPDLQRLKPYDRVRLVVCFAYGHIDGQDGFFDELFARLMDFARMGISLVVVTGFKFRLGPLMIDRRKFSSSLIIPAE